MTTIKLLYGVLTNENAASSYGQPVLVYNSVAHGVADMMDMGIFGLEQAFEHGRRAIVPADGLDASQVALMGKWVAAGCHAGLYLYPETKRTDLLSQIFPAA